MKRDSLPAPERAAGGGAEPPVLRLFALLERIAAHDRLFSLHSLVADTGWPKPSVHRMLQQLEQGGLVRREGDTRHYSTGVRLRRFAEALLANSSFHGARHRVLRALVDEVGESCNITAFVAGEVVYLDRVETAAPLRFTLHPGSRVPAHCSASGKLFLAQMSRAQRRRLLASGPLAAYTARTLTDPEQLDAELERVKRDGYAFDDEEFLPGLFCIAVPVPQAGGRSNLGIAVQAPTIRLGAEKALRLLPALQRAAATLGAIDAEAAPAAAEAPTRPRATRRRRA